MNELVFEVGRTVFEGIGDALAPRPRTLTSRIGYVCFILAVFVAFLFPVTAYGGTETPLLRWLTVAALAAAGVAFFAARGRFGPAVAGLAVLVVGGFVTSAPWLRGLAGLLAVWFTIVSVREGRAGVGAAPEAPVEPESESETAGEIVESIATAFVLALIVREFACEAFKIPTGSMEPTIMGEGYNKRTGDRLLAAKAPLLFGEPERWSIVVFKYPLFRPTNYIKRLVGLSGERLQNKGGDIYVNGKCIAKPEEVQETLWAPMLPDESGKWQGGVGKAFTSDGGAQWEFGESGATGTAADGKTGFIVHESGIGDVRMSFDVDGAALGGGAVIVRLDGSGRRVELEARRDEISLAAPGRAKAKLEDVEGLGSSKSRLGFAVADRVVRVYRNGRLVARIETADEPNLDENRAEKAWIGVTGGTARITGLALEHDLQYSDQGAGDWQIPEGSYFMMGDNTRQSRDSRLWQAKVFRLNDGREFVADDNNIRLDDVHAVPSVQDVGDAYDIFDSYGVPRHLAKTDLVGGTWKMEYRPFVRREDLVGRAFLIFFPFPPMGEWRPRILP